MPGDILAVRVKTFGTMELTEPSINAGILELDRYLSSELNRRKFRAHCFVHGEPFGMDIETNRLGSRARTTTDLFEDS